MGLHFDSLGKRVMVVMMVLSLMVGANLATLNNARGETPSPTPWAAQPVTPTPSPDLRGSTALAPTRPLALDAASSTAPSTSSVTMASVASDTGVRAFLISNWSGIQEPADWTQAIFDDSSWSYAVPTSGNSGWTGYIPGATAIWATTWAGDGDKVLFRKTFTLPSDFGYMTPSASVDFVADNLGDVYVNGQLVGQSAGNWGGPAYHYVVDASILRAGSNVIAVRGINHLEGNYGWYNPGEVRFLLVVQGAAEPTYSISGRVADNTTSHSPIVGVTISDGAGHTTNTDENGHYALPIPEAKWYSIAPSMPGYGFSPAKRTVNVVQDVTGQDFIGVQDGGMPSLHLEVPVESPDGGTYGAFGQIMALQNWDRTYGRVSSWFDHKYPNYGYNNGTGIWLSNQAYTRTETMRWVPPNLLCYGAYCYDGHNGIDFSHDTAKANELVLAAASGTVTSTVTNCPEGRDTSCGNYYGNQVVIDHHNGYYTLYGHLRAVSVTTTTLITDSGQPLGVMGSSGRSGSTHLHFGVYRDDGNGKWDGTEVEKTVDPFGWQSTAAVDPWVAVGGQISYPLWRWLGTGEYSLDGNQGGAIATQTGDVRVSIPTGVFSGATILDLSPAPVAAPSAQLRSTGHSFRLRLLDGLPVTGSQQKGVGLQSPMLSTLSQPISLTVTYTDSDVLHLDVSQLFLYWWDDTLSEWQALPTSLDQANHTITAETSEFGDFSLMASLLCACDKSEPDDSFYEAKTIVDDGTPIRDLFDVPMDEDWFRLDAVAGQTYLIRTDNQGLGVSTAVQLVDSDGTTLLASSDNSGSVRLDWQAPFSGAYFIRVKPASGSATGCDATYDLSVAGPPVQYSDPFTRTVLVAGTISQSSDLPVDLSLIDNLDGTATISGTIQDPARTYTATITVSDTQGLTDTKQVEIVVTKEDAQVGYTGDSHLQEGSPVTLVAMVSEVVDGSPGDITKANVFFGVTPPNGGTTTYGPVAVSASGLETQPTSLAWPAGYGIISPNSRSEARYARQTLGPTRPVRG